MKIKKEFMLREVANNYIVVPVGRASKTFNGMITLNESSAYLWRQLSENITIEELIQRLMNEYDIDICLATHDVNAFISKLKEINVLEE